MCRVLLPESALEMVVTWSTAENTKASICEYGIKSITDYVATSKKGPKIFVDGGADKASQYIHRVSRSRRLSSSRQDSANRFVATGKTIEAAAKHDVHV